MDAASGTRRPCFVEDDDRLASLADMEAGFSGSLHHHHPSFFSRPLYYTALQRRGSLRSLSASSVSSPRSGRLCDGRYEDHHQPHFLDACFLCKKPLGDDRDIFMYRGDTPFCSVECRQEQMERDEAEEKNRNISASIKAMRKDQRKSTSPSKNCDYPFRTGTMAAA